MSDIGYEPALAPKEDIYITDSRGLETYDGEDLWEGPDGHIYCIDSIHDIRLEQSDAEWAQENGYTKTTVRR